MVYHWARDNLRAMAIGSLDEIRAFCAVAEVRSFTAAAARLQVTTNAISLRVRRLEAALGVRLFVRTTRQVSMTDEGVAVHKTMARLLDEVDALEAEVRPDPADLKGTVRIAMPGVLASRPFFARLRDLQDVHPQLWVQTIVSNSPIMPSTEGLDIAIYVGRPPETAFVGRLLGRGSWVLVATPEYLRRHGRPTRPADLAGHRCLRLLANPAQNEWTLVDTRGREHTVPVGRGYEADDSRSLGDAAYAGLGIGLRPAGEAARAVTRKQLEIVLPKFRFQPLDIHALLPQGRIRVPRVAACLQVLRDAVRELA
jgi:DNA-binding transcriptional LysR family regulator